MNSQTVTEAADDEDAIRAIHRRMIDAWNAGDALDFAAPFTQEADFVAFEGTRLEGEVKFVRFLSDALAVMHSVVRVTLQGEAEPSPSRDSMQLTGVVKRDGEWRSEGLMNARRLTLERQFFLDELDSLPAEAQRRVTDLVASLRKQYC